ncbi:3'-5' exonuclease [Pseudomonas sp. ZM23]|uniref:3'-5' exonuclease n=1 Tax=Pseudomonas triclosanedens TaxID=2961893 RepID=A0ABY7A2Y8_9PSED|nr:3'-5' exonuclease [Pseudomonas triclosanedens]MCP8467806.1 3'-5' exonuclease [Pseudomonas triclosanedens]MCP8473773.1 3'-5' exonuclease [Pseudomonas triclosanedens]MCP8479695.1 3'-5' exonuclease [Pseudomonas triclosanedens]WAI51376.1 3'-5' exonuclease [Pseudomonas triclosanedens]
MNACVCLPDHQWSTWRRRLYWWRHDPADAEELVSLDLETTSLDPRRADILSVGAVVVRRGKLILGERLELLVQAPPSLDGESIRIHKLRRADLEGQLPLDEVLRRVVEFIGDRPLLGYYLSFDVAVLRRHLRERLGLRLDNPRVEVSELYYRKMSRRFPDLHLDLRFDTLARNLDIPIEGRHTAIGDACTTALMFLRLRKGSLPRNLV